MSIIDQNEGSASPLQPRLFDQDESGPVIWLIIPIKLVDDAPETKGPSTAIAEEGPGWANIMGTNIPGSYLTAGSSELLLVIL
ncbi:MAG: hypothetical protein H6558_19140 [Lewinellaceae bacterium]|nr:hypothetical protein [Lewinellaceae bacterium]